MSTEIKKEIELEIAHVLFIDIVGYSKLLINQQRALLDTLAVAVRQCHERQLGHLEPAELKALVELLHKVRQPHEPPGSTWISSPTWGGRTRPVPSSYHSWSGMMPSLL